MGIPTPAGDRMSVLDRLVQRWRRAWAFNVGLASAATAVLAAALSSRTLGASPPPLLVGLAVGAGLAIGLLLRRQRVDALVIARHLNRTVPALEESSDLLLRAPEQLSPIERMQRARAERTLRDLLPEPELPSRGRRLAATYAGVALLGALGILAIAAPGAARTTPSGAVPPAAHRPHGPPALTDIQVTIQPPAYMRKPARHVSGWELDAEQGARVTWRLRVDQPVDAVLLVTTDGDSIRAGRRRDAEFELSLPAEHSLLYQVSLAEGATGTTSDYHRLTVIPDVAPTLTVVRPEPRTEIRFRSPQWVPLEVLATDDYGLADARIIATLTKGAGEAVKFREQVLEFDSWTPRAGAHPAVVLRRMLDPAALAMQPGDELYFYVVIHDNRRPQPNETRSETYFISIADTTHIMAADWSGLGVNTLPEYLRSQRQIIIDTEELLAQVETLTVQTAHDRSNNIGLDQHLLRERYGEIVGQEDVVAGTDPTIEHEHDTPESATRLAQSVKDTLQAAVAQMWQAELRLRTYEPRAALPYEYRALELLKAAQQAARAYVQRVGFEPPPLEPDRKRLTGTLTAIGNPTSRRALTAAPTLASVRAALEVVQRLRHDGQRRPGDADLLESAGREMAQLAIHEPGAHLETLRGLRSLVDSLHVPAATVCQDCLVLVERGLWGALPAADPERVGRTPAAGLARNYFDRLQRPAGRRP